VYFYAAENADVVLNIIGTNEEISIELKPFAFNFLEDMKSKYELILYSFLDRKYLLAILNYLERDEKYFEYILDESYCLYANVFQGVKYLNFLCSTRSLSNIVVVDTSVKNFPFDPDNFIPALSSSTFLPKLGRILNLIAKESDVRKVIKKYSERTIDNQISNQI